MEFDAAAVRNELLSMMFDDGSPQVDPTRKGNQRQMTAALAKGYWLGRDDMALSDMYGIKGSRSLMVEIDIPESWDRRGEASFTCLLCNMRCKCAP